MRTAFFPGLCLLTCVLGSTIVLVVGCSDTDPNYGPPGAIYNASSTPDRQRWLDERHGGDGSEGSIPGVLRLDEPHARHPCPALTDAEKTIMDAWIAAEAKGGSPTDAEGGG